MPDFTDSPLSTIDIGALKPSRFLDEKSRALPYRDAEGRIHLLLLRQGAEKLKAGSVKASEEASTKLTKWLQHAEAWRKKATHTWTQRADGGWSGGPAGQESIPPAAAPAAPAKRQRTASGAAAPAAAAAAASGSADVARKVSQKGDVQQTRYDVKSKPRSQGGGVRKEVVKGLAAVDPSCPVAEQCHVYTYGAKGVHDALLNQVNIGNNNNKFYIIQLLETDAGKQYYAWNRWGRVGRCPVPSLYLPCTFPVPSL